MTISVNNIHITIYYTRIVLLRSYVPAFGIRTDKT
jgi:hypothetical protein